VSEHQNSTDQSSAPRGGRSLIYVFAALLIFAGLWWLTTPGASPRKIELATPIASAPIAAPVVVAVQATPQTRDNMTIDERVADFMRVTTTPRVERILGPSKGSLLEKPKPRDMAASNESYARLPPLERQLTARMTEEAEWMDLQNFPTLEEINSLDAEKLDKLYGPGTVNLRATAIRAAIWQRRGDPRWKIAATELVFLGCPFGTRLMIDDLLTQRTSAARDQQIITNAALGVLLGDVNAVNYQGIKQWTSWDSVNNWQEALHYYRVIIPESRARAGLPPLQVVRRPN
jgi:hypothetical protein